jgi:hypothetical protein
MPHGIFEQLSKMGFFLPKFLVKKMGILVVNGTSIIATTLDFTTILNMLACISNHLWIKDGQILAIPKNVLEYESLIGSKRRLVQ